MTFTFPSASVSSRRRLVPIQRLAVVGQCNLTSRRLAERSGWGLPRPLSAARCPLSAPLRTLARLPCQARFRPRAVIRTGRVDGRLWADSRPSCLVLLGPAVKGQDPDCKTRSHVVRTAPRAAQTAALKKSAVAIASARACRKVRQEVGRSGLGRMSWSFRVVAIVEDATR
jgi:hypothetical protein